ncbi:UNVERIFIED_CONTAM: GYF domain-containing protein [Hammondia hammondi]|eukprot:XP_008881836.1 GYF domain-containing protein [Hammondia hammondi]
MRPSQKLAATERAKLSSHPPDQPLPCLSGKPRSSECLQKRSSPLSLLHEGLTPPNASAVQLLHALRTHSKPKTANRVSFEQPQLAVDRGGRSVPRDGTAKRSSSASDRGEARGADDKHFPYYDTESEDEKQKERFQERSMESDWLEEQRSSITDQQRRFQALVDRLRLREGDVHLAPSVRNNVLSKLQGAVPSPVSLACSSQESGVDMWSPSSFSHASSFPSSPNAAKKAEEDPALDPTWTHASALVRRLQQVHAQREELERWEREQRRLQQEQRREFLEKQREREKKEWEEQMARQIATNKEVQKELDERLKRGKTDGDVASPSPHTQIKKLLSEKPPDALIGLVKEAQAKGEEMFPAVPPREQKTRGDVKDAKPVVQPRPGITLHVQSLQICWWRPDSSTRQRRPRREGAQRGDSPEKNEARDTSPGPDDEDGEASACSSSDSSSSDEDVAANCGGTAAAVCRGQGVESRSKRSLKPPATVVPGAVNYCLVARYAEEDQSGVADVPVFTTAWYAARVALSQPKKKDEHRGAGSGEGRRGADAKGQGGLAGTDPAKQGEQREGEANRQTGGQLALGRRATVAAAYLGKALGQQAGKAGEEKTAEAGKEDGEAKKEDASQAPRKPVLTVVKEACVIDADITLPQLTTLQAMRVNENCLVLQIWRYEKQLRTRGKRVESSSTGPAKEDPGGPGLEQKRRGRPGDEHLAPMRYRHHVEEVGRVRVLLEDPRVYDKSQSVFTITPVQVLKAAYNAQFRLGQASVGLSAATKGFTGAEFNLPSGRHLHSKRLSLAATAITSSGTLYAFITSTTRKAAPLRSASRTQEMRGGRQGQHALRDARDPRLRKEMLRWKYVDDFKVLQGPFSSQQMLDWIRAGYFEEDAPICPADETYRLRPLRLVVGKIRQDAEEFRRQSHAFDSSKVEKDEENSPGSRRGSPVSYERSTSPSPEDRRREEDPKNGGDKRLPKSPKAGDKPENASRNGNSFTITVTTTADSEPARTPMSSGKQSPKCSAPATSVEGKRDHDDGKVQLTGLPRKKGAEVQSVMKLLEEATNCLSRISSHRMSNYLRYTVADRAAELPPVQVASSVETPPTLRNSPVFPPGGAVPAMPESSRWDAHANPANGRYGSPVSQQRHSQIRGKMQALEQMFGRTALREACAVYIQAAVRGWLQRLRLWRTYQAEVAAATAALAEWEAQQVGSGSSSHAHISPPGVSANFTHFPDRSERQFPTYVSPRRADSRGLCTPPPQPEAHNSEDIWGRGMSFSHGADACTSIGYTNAWPSLSPQSLAAPSAVAMDVHPYTGWSSDALAACVGSPLESGSLVGSWRTQTGHSDGYGAFGRNHDARAGVGEWGQSVSQGGSFLSYTQLAAERGIGPCYADAFHHP